MGPFFSTVALGQEKSLDILGFSARVKRVVNRITVLFSLGFALFVLLVTFGAKTLALVTLGILFLFWVVVIIPLLLWEERKGRR